MGLANTYGRLERAEALRHMRAAAPELAVAMAGQWRTGCVDMWQRDSTQPGGWARERSERGVWQGSRLAQVPFGVALAAALRDVWAATIPAPPTAVVSISRQVRHSVAW